MKECFKCGSKKISMEIDWLSNAEESVETFYCDDCHEFLGVGNLV